MGQRLVRAKARIRLAGIAFRLPEQGDLQERMQAVLAAIYAAFGTGWADQEGSVRLRDLTQEAIWLGRLVVSLLPEEPEGLGLLALMLYAESAAMPDATPPAITCRWISRRSRPGTTS